MMIRITPARQRRLERTAHLVFGALVIAYVYAPLGEAVANLIRWVVLPGLVGSGLAMWQAARIRRFLRRDRSASSAVLRRAA